MKMLYRFVDGVENTYVNGVPYHLQDNGSTMLYKTNQELYSKLTVGQVQEILKESHIVVTERKELVVQFDKDGLMQLKSLLAIIPIEGSLLI
jgi:hypothetical protein